MYFNAETERAIRNIDHLAEETRRVIQKLNPPQPNDIVWDVIQGRWVHQGHTAVVR